MKTQALCSRMNAKYHTEAGKQISLGFFFYLQLTLVTFFFRNSETACLKSKYIFNMRVI